MNQTMISTGFAPDPALAGRDLLLDEGWVHQRLAERLGLNGPLDIETCTRVRAKYRIGESLRATYRLDTPTSTQLVTARMFTAPDTAAGAYTKARGSAVPVPGLHPVLFDGPYGTVWWALPNDRRLRNAAALLAPESEAAAAVIQLPLALALPGWSRSHIAEYSAERCLTLRATDRADTTLGYVKLFAPGRVDVQALARRYQQVARTLPCPRVLHVGRDLFIQEPLPGLTLAQIEPNQEEAALGELGRVIARLHGMDGMDRMDGMGGITAAPAFRRLEVERVVHSVELVALARPDVAPLTRHLARRLRPGPPAGEAPVLLHGDCHPKNALVHGSGVALIDLDQAGIGPAAADLASMLARLAHRAIVGDLGTDRAETLGEAFLGGYAEVRALPQGASLAWHTAAALVAERAIRAVNRVDVKALGRLDQVLEVALGLVRDPA